MDNGRRADDRDAGPVLSGEEWAAAAGSNNRPRTTDDVSITWDGRRLDTKEKVLTFLAEIEADRVAGVSFEELLRRNDECRTRP
ncbi:MAG: hypothetical protein ACRDJU_03525 [Actinomycetota bacterium]